GGGGGGVEETEGGGEAGALEEPERLLEILVRLAGEPDDDVGRELDAWNRGAQGVDAPQVAVPVVAAAHAAEHAVRSRLHGKVQVRAHPGQHRHRADEVVGEMHRMRGREANALDARNRV